jgi:creatinine amidohydrolase
MVFPGTLTLRPETLSAVIADVCHSVAHHGVRKLVIVNGHGGNEGLIQMTAIPAASAGLTVAALSYWNLIPDPMRQASEQDGGRIGHAGEMETSLQLYLQPGCVDETAARLEPGADLLGLPLARFEGSFYAPPDPGRESPTGVYGRPSAGQATKGERLVRAASEALAAFIREFHAAP